MSRSASLVEYTLTSPFAPAGTVTAFAVIVPVTAFSEATVGCGCPAGHAVRYPSGPLGSAVKFKPYASAAAGTAQSLSLIGKLRALCAAKAGPPKAPAA